MEAMVKAGFKLSCYRKEPLLIFTGSKDMGIPAKNRWNEKIKAAKQICRSDVAASRLIRPVSSYNLMPDKLGKNPAPCRLQRTETPRLRR